MEKHELAVAEFKKGFNCSQSVFSAYSEQFGISADTAKMVSTAFGGGIAMAQETCGALTGAYMLIGCKFFDPNNPKESRALVNKKCNELAAKFKEIHGAISCKPLVGVDFQDEQALQKAREEGLFHKICPDYIADACKLVEEIIH